MSCAPEILVLMPCGFDVDRILGEIDLLSRLPGWDDLSAVQERKVFAVNSHAYYSRSGPRLVDGLEVLAHIVHPGLFPCVIPSGILRRIDPRRPKDDRIGQAAYRTG